MQQQAGFTLIEIMIALTVFAVGILAVAAMQGTALRAATTAEQHTRARTAAKSKAECLLALPFDHTDLVDRDGDGAGGLEDTGSDSVGDPGAEADYGPITLQDGMRLYWNIAEDTPRSGTKTICVTTLWDAKGKVRRARLTFSRTDNL